MSERNWRPIERDRGSRLYIVFSVRAKDITDSIHGLEQGSIRACWAYTLSPADKPS